ncbi:MAG TPA: glycosyltransferase family 2 protein [Candidatus Polarisedimenticolaceae bacterium]|nr:glycosyltransferase family 2 protein [Candidatus Polarisedimenticolaceae bacterium]
MGAAGLTLAIAAGALSAAWCAFLLHGLRTALRFRRFADLSAPLPASWPRLSVIVAACDEEETIGPALETLLAQDYPELEIVVVDDRSRDATGRIADAAARRDPRLAAVHVSALPDGWLGKVHALDRGVAAARGDWLLFTDADVHFSSDVLRRAVAYAEAERLDHLTVAPELIAPGFVEEMVNAAFITAFLAGTRAIDVGRSGSKAFVGVGAFNLVRRSTFARTPGFRWLAMEVLDDVGLGLMMKNAGGRAAFAIGLGDVTITWYRSLRAMARGLEKNMFGAFCHYRVRRLLAILAGAAVVLPAPLVALGIEPRPWLPLLGGAALALVAANALVLSIRARRPWLPLALAPLGAAVFVGLVTRSAWRCLRDGGITWRGTLYPLDALRDGQRVKL